MKLVLITGTSRGIGKATAVKFLKEGWKVIGTSTTGKSGIKHPEYKTLKLDLSQKQSITNFVSQVYELKVKIDVLVNNAGIILNWENEMIATQVLRDTLEVNLIGTIDLTQKLIPLISDGGHVINISSAAGSLNEVDRLGDYSGTYQISKVGLNMYSRVLAVSLKSRKITVSSLDPGWVKTDMGGDDAPGLPNEPAEEIFNLANSRVDSGYFWKKGKKRSW